MADSTISTLDQRGMAATTAQHRKGMAATFRQYRYLYLMLAVPFLYFFVYRYYPILGSVIAFKDYKLMDGIWGSQWVGLQHFRDLFGDPMFIRALRNTVVIAVLKLIFVFPAPIILALFLNEIRSLFYKRFIQTVVYAPHFLSWVIYAAILYVVLSPVSGLVNNLIGVLGADAIPFFQRPELFQPIVIASSIFKETGWAAVIYLASIAAIDPQLYEAAHMDGANRWQMMRHITIPGLASTIIILLILQLGYFLVVGFDQLFILQNNIVLPTGDIIETFIYRIGLQQGRFDYATAAGLFNSAVGLILVVLADRGAKRFGQPGLF